MCGIAGYVLTKPLAEPELLAKQLVESLRHRGPDDTGTHLTGRYGIVNTRLSIIDVRKGKQPFVSKDAKVYVIQNGEIYNFLELRKELAEKGHHFETLSDTEVLLHAYEEYGTEFISKCNGMFAIAILDLRKQKLFLFRDRIGVKPLFIFEGEEGLYFSSEIKSFLTISSFSRTVDPQSLYYFLIYNYVPLPHTIFKDVSHVEPGHWASVDLNTLARDSHQYWGIKNEPENGVTKLNDYIDNLDEIFRDAVSIRLRSDVPIGIFLSSGLDSSLVAGGINSVNKEPRRAFSIRFEDQRFDESAAAGEFARSLGWEHSVTSVGPDDLQTWQKSLWFSDQPHGDISFIALSKLSKLAAEHLKVVYTGDGGDEAFAGYDRYLKLLQVPQADEGRALQEFFSSESVTNEDGILKKLCTENFLNSVEGLSGFGLFTNTIAKVSAKDLINKVLYFDMKQLLPGNNLVKVDRMTMAHSLEARSPFLDYRFYESLFSVHGAQKLAENKIRYLQRKLAERYLPAELIYREKKMLAVPVGEWFRTNSREYLVNFFNQEKIWARGYFKKEFVKQLIQEHIEGKVDHRRILRSLMSFELWINSIEEFKQN
jgi:asparagine synthase (glutamine-hydrolysing)